MASGRPCTLRLWPRLSRSSRWRFMSRSCRVWSSIFLVERLRTTSWSPTTLSETRSFSDLMSSRSSAMAAARVSLMSAAKALRSAMQCAGCCDVVGGPIRPPSRRWRRHTRRCQEYYLRELVRGCERLGDEPWREDAMFPLWERNISEMF